MKRIAIAALASALSAVAVAGDDVEHPYVGLDYQLGRFESSAGTANPQAARLTVGTEVVPMFAVQAQIATGVQSDKIARSGVNYDISLNNLYGVYLRPQLALGTDVASIYALAGYSWVNLDSKASNNSFPSANATDSAFSWGVGLDANVYEGLRLNVDYTQYIKSYKTLNVGVRIPIN